MLGVKQLCVEAFQPFIVLVDIVHPSIQPFIHSFVRVVYIIYANLKSAILTLVAAMAW